MQKSMHLGNNGSEKTRPQRPIRSNDLADLLNDCLRQPGQKVRFEFDDDSYLEVAIISQTNLGTAGAAWVECGRLGVSQ